MDGGSGTEVIGKAEAWYRWAQQCPSQHRGTQGSRESKPHKSVSPLAGCEALKTEDNLQGT